MSDHRAALGPIHAQPRFTEDCVLENVDLEGCDVYEFSLEEIQKELDEYKFCVLGGIMGPRASLEGMKAFVEENWGAHIPSMSVKKNGIWSFSFSDQAGVDFVLSNGPWFFEGKFPIALTLWEMGKPVAWSSFESVPAWIQLRNLNPIFYSKHMLSIIASMVGTAVIMDEDTRAKSNMDKARMLVQVAPKDILKEKVVLKDPAGKLYHLRIWYEWVPWVCDHCEVFGHEQRRCKNISIREDSVDAKGSVGVTGSDPVVSGLPSQNQVAEAITVVTPSVAGSGKGTSDAGKECPRSNTVDRSKNLGGDGNGRIGVSASGKGKATVSPGVSAIKGPKKHAYQYKKQQGVKPNELRVLRSSGALAGAKGYV